MIENSNYNKEWQENRIKFILSLYDESFFKGKKILELGAFHGDIGNYFSKLGADVTCVEGLYGNYKVICEKYPHIKSLNLNLDTDEWEFGEFDIIINFGLFYHLENHHEEHLKNCLNNCDLLFFESVILDSNDSKIYFREESGIDQSLSEVGGTPSAKYVENIFIDSNFKYQRFDYVELDGVGASPPADKPPLFKEHQKDLWVKSGTLKIQRYNPHIYSWLEENSDIFDGYKRRFWVANKK